MNEKIEYRPIGVIRSEHTCPEETPIQPIYAKGCRGRAELLPEYAEGLADIEGFSHLYLLYHFHRSDKVKLKVKPFLQDVEHGIFATRAPFRPNGIGLSIVELVRREGNVLHLNGVDVLDGTPLLDVKPYAARFDCVATTRNGWHDAVDEADAQVRGKRGYRPPSDAYAAQPQASLEETVRFHGHICPGLAIGYRAAMEGLARLNTRRSGDEEVIAIVENDSCSVDAVQWITGCTFGKGNLFFRDYGKQVFTFALRPGGRAVRVALKPRADRTGEPPREDREARTQWLLTAPVDDLFSIQEASPDLPPPASIRESLRCDRCGEDVMSTRVRRRGRFAYCIPCLEGVAAGPEER